MTDYDGHTWYPIKFAVCPECGGDLYSNGAVESCEDCDWTGEITREGGR